MQELKVQQLLQNVVAYKRLKVFHSRQLYFITLHPFGGYNKLKLKGFFISV